MGGDTQSLELLIRQFYAAWNTANEQERLLEEIEQEAKQQRLVNTETIIAKLNRHKGEQLDEADIRGNLSAMLNADDHDLPTAEPILTAEPRVNLTIGVKLSHRNRLEESPNPKETSTAPPPSLETPGAAQTRATFHVGQNTAPPPEPAPEPPLPTTSPNTSSTAAPPAWGTSSPHASTSEGPDNSPGYHDQQRPGPACADIRTTSPSPTHSPPVSIPSPPFSLQSFSQSPSASRPAFFVPETPHPTHTSMQSNVTSHTVAPPEATTATLPPAVASPPPRPASTLSSSSSDSYLSVQGEYGLSAYEIACKSAEMIANIHVPSPVSPSNLQAIAAAINQRTPGTPGIPRHNHYNRTAVENQDGSITVTESLKESSKATYVDPGFDTDIPDCITTYRQVENQNGDTEFLPTKHITEGNFQRLSDRNNSVWGRAALDNATLLKEQMLTAGLVIRDHPVQLTLEFGLDVQNNREAKRQEFVKAISRQAAAFTCVGLTPKFDNLEKLMQDIGCSQEEIAEDLGKIIQDYNSNCSSLARDIQDRQPNFQINTLLQNNFVSKLQVARFLVDRQTHYPLQARGGAMKTHIAAKTFYLEGSAGQYNTDVLKDEGLRAEIRDILYEFAGEEKLREFDAFTQQYRQPQTPSPSTTPPRSSRRPRF